MNGLWEGIELEAGIRAILITGNGVNGTGDMVRAGTNTCRSYGAWPGVVGTTTINMALLTELGRPSVLKHTCNAQARPR